jgi:hypothetical protein
MQRSICALPVPPLDVDGPLQPLAEDRVAALQLTDSGHWASCVKMNVFTGSNYDLTAEEYAE